MKKIIFSLIVSIFPFEKEIFFMTMHNVCSIWLWVARVFCSKDSVNNFHMNY